VPKSYPPEFRRKVIDLVEAGRPVAQVAADLGISEQIVYIWRRQHLVDSGRLPGTTSSENAEVVGARRHHRPTAATTTGDSPPSRSTARRPASATSRPSAASTAWRALVSRLSESAVPA
jgi:transposase-like protein